MPNVFTYNQFDAAYRAIEGLNEFLVNFEGDSVELSGLTVEVSQQGEDGGLALGTIKQEWIEDSDEPDWHLTFTPFVPVALRNDEDSLLTHSTPGTVPGSGVDIPGDAPGPGF